MLHYKPQLMSLPASSFATKLWGRKMLRHRNTSMPNVFLLFVSFLLAHKKLKKKDARLNHDLRHVCDMNARQTRDVCSQMCDESLHHQTYMMWLDLEVCYIRFTSFPGNSQGFRTASSFWKLQKLQGLTCCKCFLDPRIVLCLFFCFQSGCNSYSSAIKHRISREQNKPPKCDLNCWREVGDLSFQVNLKSVARRL